MGAVEKGRRKERPPTPPLASAEDLARARACLPPTAYLLCRDERAGRRPAPGAETTSLLSGVSETAASIVLRKVGPTSPRPFPSQGAESCACCPSEAPWRPACCSPRARPPPAR